MADHERIWLEPGGGADPSVGRLWCQDDVWTGDLAYEGELPTEYVRADIHAARVAEERARIVAWLKREAERLYDAPASGAVITAVRRAADAIERGADQEDRDAG